MKKLIFALLLIPCFLKADMVPPEVMNKIIEEAERKYPDNYFMINYTVQSDVKQYKAYLELKSVQKFINEKEGK